MFHLLLTSPLHLIMPDIHLTKHLSPSLQSVSDTGVLSVLVGLEGDGASSEDLKTKCRRALKSIIGV